MLKQRNKSIYLLGEEGTGWSIDKDRYYTLAAIRSLGYSVTNKLIRCDVVYAVWWNKLVSRRYYWILKLLNKKVVAVITNDLSHQRNKLPKLVKITDHFVVANSKQRNILLDFGVEEKDIFLIPFFVDRNIFRDLSLTRKQLSRELDLDFNRVDGKVLLGSFQRDSVGNDLSQAKWQKNPDLLVNLMKALSRDKYLLVLAGPRRHYLIGELKKNNIDYIFVGNEDHIINKSDDLIENNLPEDKVNLLYNLCDYYIVSSRSEGGPKAIPESILSNTIVFSSEVGFAQELLPKELIYKDVVHLVNVLNSMSLINRDKLLNNAINNVDKYYDMEKFTNNIDRVLRNL